MKFPASLSVRQLLQMVCRLFRKQAVHVRLFTYADNRKMYLSDGMKTLEDVGVEDGCVIGLEDVRDIVFLNLLVWILTTNTPLQKGMTCEKGLQSLRVCLSSVSLIPTRHVEREEVQTTVVAHDVLRAQTRNVYMAPTSYFHSALPPTP